VLDKLKKIFMKKEKIGEMRIPTEELQKEDEALENQDAVISDFDENGDIEAPNPDPIVEVAEPTEIEATDDELEQMNDPAGSDPDYLEYSAEAVGYQDRESQWNIYRTVTSYLLPDEDGELSIIDFGCGRGDFERFYETEFPGQDIDYVGIDMNQQLINAGKKAYNDEVDIRCMDWLNVPSDLKEDWAININSNNLRYDGDTTKNDEEYLHATIESMYKHANKGVVIMMATGQNPDGLINYKPSPLLEWAIKKYRIVTLDHSIGEDLFTLIIYKNEE